MRLPPLKVRIGLGVAMVAIVGVVLLAQSETPSVGEISHPPVSSAARPAPNRQLQGRFFSLAYPAIFSSSSQVGDATALEQYRFIGISPSEASLAVTIHPLPNNQLINDSSYHLRVLEPDRYHEHLVSVAAGQADIMSRLDGSESTAFLVHANKVATIAVTGTPSSSSLQAQVEALAAMFRWHS